MCVWFPKRQICLVSLQLSCFSFLPSHRAPPSPRPPPPARTHHMFSYPRLLGGRRRREDERETEPTQELFVSCSISSLPLLTIRPDPPSPASSPLPAFLLRASPSALPGKIYPQKRQRRRGEGAERGEGDEAWLFN